MAEKSTSKFTSAMLGEQAGEVTASSLLSDFAEQRYQPVVQADKRGGKADKDDLERHALPHLGASRLSGRPHLIPLSRNAFKGIRKLPCRADVPWLFFTSRETHRASIDCRCQQARESFGRASLRCSFEDFLVSNGVDQRDLRTGSGYCKPETLALAQNNSFENKVRV